MSDYKTEWDEHSGCWIILEWGEGDLIGQGRWYSVDSTSDLASAQEWIAKQEALDE